MCSVASERGGGRDEGVEEAALGASREPAFPIRQWHLLRGTWASGLSSRSFILFSDCALGNTPARMQHGVLGYLESRLRSGTSGTTSRARTG